MNLYIVRHGNPDYVNDRLTELGHKQAESCAHELAKLNIDEIYSSPYGRAQETAAHLAELIGKPVQIEPWAHEVEHYGDNLAGGVTFAVSMPPYFLRSPEIEAMGDKWATHPAFRGEEGVLRMVNEIKDGATDFLARMGYVVEGNRLRIEQNNEKNVVLFCHAGMFLIFAGFLLQIPDLTAWHSFFMYQTGISWVNIYNYDSGYTVPRFLSINDTSHLRENGLPLT